MSDDIQIRTVTVELLRAGPAHNQLLSPLTQYLGVCDDAEAGIVTLPFEHATFLRRMKSMRYVAGEDMEGRSDRLPVLRELGVEMAKVLGAIPCLPGSLNGDSGGPETLVHLRLVLSASELASLPFEQCKVPISATSYSEGWLSLQARVPVVITRRTRNVAEGGAHWPTRPRILFLSANPDDVPYEAHRAVLLEAIQPYMKPGQEIPELSADGTRERFADLLTVVKDASFNQLADECSRQRYTHIHILAHGAEDPAMEDRAYGLGLRNPAGGMDVISGERLASAFACMVGGSIHRPSVVVLATCDSANQASVITPGASVAHVLHQAGIAMVVASQFPLSKEGSVLLASEFYPGLLRGENPWILLHRIRSGLHGRVMAHSHDWASLVVYEALPAALVDQLEDVRYMQGKRAINVAIDRIDRAVSESAKQKKPLEPQEVRQHRAELQRAIDWLPMTGRFAMECLGLRASSKKRLAEAEYNIARGAPPADKLKHVKRSLQYLEQSLDDYEHAVNDILVNKAGQAVQRVSSLHWVLVQQLCLSVVLCKPLPDGAWETARLSAEAYLGLHEVDERAWARGSLIELWLIKIAYQTLSKRDRDEALHEAEYHAAELVKLYHSNEAFPIQSTVKQLKRYVNWWGYEMLDGDLHKQFPGMPTWKELGVVEAASCLIDILDRRSALGRLAADVEADAPPDGDEDVPAPRPWVAVTESPGAEVKPGPKATATTKSKSSAKLATRAGEAFFSIDMLPASHGDCLWLEYGVGKKTHRVLIDCGTDSTYKHLQARLAALPADQREFELFILSHIDDDHIGGAIPLLKDKELGVRFGDIWFNGWKHLREESRRLGAVQGEVFSALIEKQRLPWNRWRKDGAIVLNDGPLPTHSLPGGMQITLLSPDQAKLAPLASKWEKDVSAKGMVPGQAPQRLGKTVSTSTDVDALAAAPFNSDATPHNGSSIAVFAEFQGKRALLGADAHAPLLAASIDKLRGQLGEKRLRLDAFKLPHHASRNNLNAELMALLDCRNYLVSTNGSTFNHPDREAIARVIRHGGAQPRLWFNYRTELNAVWADAALQRKYAYQAFYPGPDQSGLQVAL